VKTQKNIESNLDQEYEYLNKQNTLDGDVVLETPRTRLISMTMLGFELGMPFNTTHWVSRFGLKKKDISSWT